MEIIKLGNEESINILIQPVDNHDLELINNEYIHIKNDYSDDFLLIAIKVDDWNYDLSPWKAQAVFGNNNFGDGARNTLNKIIDLCSDKKKRYFIGGYSLAGLFSLWAVYNTNIFSGVAAASPSMWFLNFIDYMKSNEIKTNNVYLSLGDLEDKTKNKIISTVKNNIIEAYNLLDDNVCKKLEWNIGNHFKDSDLRTAKAFAYILNKYNNL